MEPLFLQKKSVLGPSKNLRAKEVDPQLELNDLFRVYKKSR